MESLNLLIFFLSRMPDSDIQSRAKLYIQLLNKPYVIEVTLREQNLYLNCFQPLELLLYFRKLIRYFHTINIGSVGQRAEKLLVVKVEGFPKNLLL